MKKNTFPKIVCLTFILSLTPGIGFSATKIAFFKGNTK